MKMDKFTLFVCCKFLVLLRSTTVCSENTNKQIVNIADKNLTITAFSVGITVRGRGGHAAMNPAISCSNPGSSQNPVRTPRNPVRTPAKDCSKNYLLMIIDF